MTKTIKKSCCITEYDLERRCYKCFCNNKQAFVNACKINCKKKSNDKIELKTKKENKFKQVSHVNSKHVTGRIQFYTNYLLSDKTLIKELLKQIKQYCDFNNYILDYSELIQILKYKLKEFGLYIDTCNQYIINKENKIIYNFRYSNNK